MNREKYNQQQEGQIVEMLTPRYEVNPSADLKDRILEAAASQAQAATTPVRKPRRMVYFMRAAVSMAAVVAVAVVVMFNTPATAARRLLADAVVAANNAKTMILELNVRTEPNESFEFISPECHFVPTTVKVIYGEPSMWRLEKQGGRVALYDGGDKSYQWISSQHQGWVHNGGMFAEADLAAFINPQQLLNMELNIARERKVAKYHKYEVTTIGNWVNVKISATAQGDFSDSKLMLNTSIAESNTIRNYTFDRQSGQLLNMSIDVVLPGREQITIVESGAILYDEPLTAEDIVGADFSTVEFVAIDDTPKGISALVDVSAEKAAKTILSAISDWDSSILNTALFGLTPMMKYTVRTIYEGMEILSVGKSFTSGLYPGRFVRCKVRLADGQNEEVVLALRNDNTNKVWLLDGGL